VNKLLARTAVLAVLLGLVAAWAWRMLHAPPEVVQLPDAASLQWTECWFETPLLRPVHCGRLSTRPEPGETPPQFVLPVVYIPALAWQRGQPPVVYIAGGPGGAAGLDRDSMPAWFAWLEHVDWSADVILYDQRGVGLSRPQPACGDMLQRRRELLASDLSVEEQHVRMREALRACRDRLQARDWNLARFNSARNADDVLDLVATLDLSAWRIYSVSYGTRIALELMRRDPAGLQAAVLDSPYPPQAQGEANDTWLLHRSLQLFMRTCELLVDCDYRPERLRADLENAMLRLRDRPLRLELRDPEDGAPLPILFDEDDLAWLVFESQYLWSNLQLLPGAVSSLARGNVSAEMRSMLQQSVDMMLDDTLNEVVGNSVDCADNGVFERRHFLRQLEQFPLVADIRRHDWDYGACRDWPSGDTGAAFREPVYSDIPALLLAGEFDPVTPPRWAYKAARSLSHSYTFTFPGIGHGVLDSDTCGAHLVRAFLADPHQPTVPACVAFY